MSKEGRMCNEPEVRVSPSTMHQPHRTGHKAQAQILISSNTYGLFSRDAERRSLLRYELDTKWHSVP